MSGFQGIAMQLLRYLEGVFSIWCFDCDVVANWPK